LMMQVYPIFVIDYQFQTFINSPTKRKSIAFFCLGTAFCSGLFIALCLPRYDKFHAKRQYSQYCNREYYHVEYKSKSMMGSQIITSNLKWSDSGIWWNALARSRHHEISKYMNFPVNTLFPNELIAAHDYNKTSYSNFPDYMPLNTRIYTGSVYTPVVGEQRFQNPKLKVEVTKVERNVKLEDVYGPENKDSHKFSSKKRIKNSKIHFKVEGPPIMSFTAKQVVAWSISDKPVPPVRPDCDCQWVMRSSGHQDDLLAPRLWEFWVVVEHAADDAEEFVMEFGGQYVEEVSPNHGPEIEEMIGKLPEHIDLIGWGSQKVTLHFDV